MVRVERKGRVEILRLKRKKFIPEKNPCAKRLWTRIKAFFLPKAREITDEELINIIIKTFGEANGRIA